MQNFVKPGTIVTFTAPAGGVVSGTAYLVGALLVIAQASAAAGAEFEGLVEGVVTLPKVGAQAWAEGVKVYWDNGNARCTTDATAGQLVGVAAVIVGADAGETTGTVRLNGAAPSASEGPQAAEADLVDNGGGVAADGTIAAITAPNLANWDGATVFPSANQGGAIGSALVELTNAVKELSTKQNALLAKLRAAGVIAT